MSDAEQDLKAVQEALAQIGPETVTELRGLATVSNAGYNFWQRTQQSRALDELERATMEAERIRTARLHGLADTLERLKEIVG